MYQNITDDLEDFYKADTSNESARQRQIIKIL